MKKPSERYQEIFDEFKRVEMKRSITPPREMAFRNMELKHQAILRVLDEMHAEMSKWL